MSLVTANERTCPRHDEPLTWEPGGDDQPTIHGRWRCSACDMDLGHALSISSEPGGTGD